LKVVAIISYVYNKLNFNHSKLQHITI